MTRQEHYEKILALAKQYKRLMLKLPTGFGKSRIALEVLKQDYGIGKIRMRVLIVVPKLVLFDNWQREIEKWLGEDFVDWLDVQYTTYISIYKYMGEFWDAWIFDECQHFTDTCFETIMDAQQAIPARVICTSGTIPRDPRNRMYLAFTGIKQYNVSPRDAINDGILPDPRVLLIKLRLKQVGRTEVYVKNASKGNTIRINYLERFAYSKIKNRRIEMLCTQQEWYNEASSMTNYYKQQFMATQKPFFNNLWKKSAGDRLKWLSSIKITDNIIQLLQKELEGRRSITFCGNIAQADQICENAIHSKNPEAMQLLDDFNNGEIDQISAVAQLDEGVNLYDCQVGMFAMLNASEIMQKQRLGRLLRHPHPLIIVPYYENTREEEIVTKMKEDYNPELITITTIEGVKETLNSLLDADYD